MFNILLFPIYRPILLDITLTDEWTVILVIVIILIIWRLIAVNHEIEKQKLEFKKKMRN